MYTILKEERIRIDFNQGIKVIVDGPDNHYFVEVLEYPQGNDLPYYVQGYPIPKLDGSNLFNFDAEFYLDFEVNIYKFVDGFGNKKILSHRYNDYGQLVRFILDSNSFQECEIWVDLIKKYQQIHGCEVFLDSNFDVLNKEFKTYYHANMLNFYKTYRIGRFPKSSNDFKSRETRKEGILWFGNWKTFWSYQHPRFWGNLTSEEIAKDILGL
jgi:hypothetical protein